MQTDVSAQLRDIAAKLPLPAYRDFWFWLAFSVGVAGLIFSILAWIEATQARRAATAAGRTVKLQSNTIELSEIGQRLDRVQPGIRFSEARDLLADTSRRVHRATSPFSHEATFKDTIDNLIGAINTAQDALKEVRPQVGRELEAPDAVYYGIESACSTLSAHVADLIGLLEKQAFNFGGEQ